MGIGGSIFLIALGAILAFAVNANISGLDLNIVGWVLMLAGLAGLIITMWFWQSRRRAVVDTSRTVQQPATYPPPRGQVVDEYREVRREQPPL
jgi:hypothetical protein